MEAFRWSTSSRRPLHSKLHASGAPLNLPTQREQLETWLEQAKDLPVEERVAARRSIDQLPEGKSVCHGDFHPANILLSDRGAIIIDWITGTQGHPIADVARTSTLFENASLPDDSPLHVRILVELSRKLLQKVYIARYFKNSGGNPQEVDLWRPAQQAATSAWRCSKML